MWRIFENWEQHLLPLIQGWTESRRERTAIFISLSTTTASAMTRLVPHISRELEYSDDALRWSTSFKTSPPTKWFPFLWQQYARIFRTHPTQCWILQNISIFLLKIVSKLENFWLSICSLPTYFWLKNTYKICKHLKMYFKHMYIVIFVTFWAIFKHREPALEMD